MKPKSNTAIYARVSTKDQSLAPQLRDLKHYAQEKGLCIYKVYADKAVSGRKDSRLALDELMSDARKKLFDTVLVWRFDRFARSSRHLAVTLEEFNSLGINFISHSGNINLNSTVGKAMFTIISAMAQLECDIVSERVKAALRNAKANGKKFGRPPLDEKTRIKIKKLRAQGESIRNVAALLKIGKSSVERYFKKTLLKILSFNVLWCDSDRFFADIYA
jgi:DNA invertase Pin-like site-specific DNA recombinase